MADGGGYIDIHDVTTQWGVFALAGPNSRAILNEIVKDADPDTVAVEQALPLAVGAQDRTGHVPGQRDPRGLYRASWAGNCTTRSRCSATCGICCWRRAKSTG